MKVGNKNTKGSRATARGFAPWLILWPISQIPGSFGDYLFHDSSFHCEGLGQVKYLEVAASKGENIIQ